MSTEQHQHSVEFWLAKCKPTSILDENIVVDHDLFSYLGLKNFSSSLEKQYSDAKKMFKGHIESKDSSSCSFTAPATVVASMSLEYGPHDLCVEILSILNQSLDEVKKLVPRPYVVDDVRNNCLYNRKAGAVGVVKYDEDAAALHPMIAKFISHLGEP